MATTLPLGLQPINVPVLLSRDGAFVANLTKDSGDWPDGTEVELWFVVNANDLTDPIVWPATVDGGVLSWDVAASESLAVIQANAKNVRLHFNTLLWGTGKVTVK
jgi:hypothetical protein